MIIGSTLQKSIAGAAALLGLLGAARSAEAFTVTSFAPSQWRAADTTLGFTQATVEDFESTGLVSGLTYQVTGTTPSMPTPAATLPNLFDPTMDPDGTAFIGANWDGTHVFINTYDNQSQVYSVNSNWGSVTFSFAAGATKVGLSLEQMELASDGLVVNGTLLGTVGSLPGASNLVLCQPTACENGYLVVSADAGETINSVTINTEQGDGWAIDHLLFENKPMADAGVDAVASGGAAGSSATGTGGTTATGSGGGGSTGKSNASSSGCGCAVGNANSLTGLFGLGAVIGILLVNRRKRRR
jgi:MYXO-CTERM domain-containing protein